MEKENARLKALLDDHQNNVQAGKSEALAKEGVLADQIAELKDEAEAAKKAAAEAEALREKNTALTAERNDLTKKLADLERKLAASDQHGREVLLARVP